ncbi:MAG: hypothetical protein AAFY76_25050, partial [Cyanobacteria bacterium J06649_11]
FDRSNFGFWIINGFKQEYFNYGNNPADVLKCLRDDLRYGHAAKTVNPKSKISMTLNLKPFKPITYCYYD